MKSKRGATTSIRKQILALLGKTVTLKIASKPDLTGEIYGLIRNEVLCASGGQDHYIDVGTITGVVAAPS